MAGLVGLEGNEKKQEEWEVSQLSLRINLVTCNSEKWQDLPEFTGLTYVGGIDISFIKNSNVRLLGNSMIDGLPEITKCRTVNSPRARKMLVSRKLLLHEHALVY